MPTLQVSLWILIWSRQRVEGEVINCYWLSDAFWGYSCVVFELWARNKSGFLMLLARFLCLTFLFSWTLCIHQFIHLNIYQFLASWKTRSFIQSISVNSLCVFVLLNNIWYHNYNFHFLVWSVNVTMQGCYVMGETLTILTLRRVTSQ